jgi:hypothetical protein
MDQVVNDGSPIPLRLTNMAHMSTPLRDGTVLDGIKQLVAHTLTECTAFCQNVTTAGITASAPYHRWSHRDLAVSKFAYRAVQSHDAEIIPFALKRCHTPLFCYVRRAAVYLQPPGVPRQSFLAELDTFEREVSYLEHWKTQGSILAMITLYYVSREQLTPEEMDGRETDDIPATLLFQATVEYKTLAPSTRSAHVGAKLEELAMRSFGGSRDDGFKIGALAGLADPVAAYSLDIHSVRGKRYRFDLCSTASSVSNDDDGDPNEDEDSNNGHNNNNKNINNNSDSTTAGAAVHHHIAIKPLCVTIDHRMDEMVEEDNDEDDEDDDDNDDDEVKKTAAAIQQQHPVVKMEFSMCGKPRNYSKSNTDWMDELPSFHHIPNGLADAFLRLNPQPPRMVTASPSGHTLILDPVFAGRIYINGQYCTTWGQDVQIASHGTALFGMDLYSNPNDHPSVHVPTDAFGTIQDYEAVKLLYAQLWHEILIDARLLDLRLARRLLFRLMKGTDPPNTGINDSGGEDDDPDGAVDDGYDDFLDDDDDAATPASALEDCLESLVLSASTYDRVGIAPKALATRFAEEFGREAFPCQSHEVEWVRRALPDRDPVVVPWRLIAILRRGGYFDIQKTADTLWFTESRPLAHGTETTIAEIAVRYLEAAGCADVDGDNIVVFSSPVASNVVAKDAVCRWNASSEQFFVHQDFFAIPIQEYTENLNQNDPVAIKGYLLGMYIAKVHPNGRILARYVLRGGVP